jgi:hypothetical protein
VIDDQEMEPMNWAAAFFAATIWLIAASLWQMYRPMSPNASHRQVGIRLLQDLAPALLLGLLMARVIDT